MRSIEIRFYAAMDRGSVIKSPVLVIVAVRQIHRLKLLGWDLLSIHPTEYEHRSYPVRSLCVLWYYILF